MVKENRKKYILGILLIGAILLVTGVTYALWSMTLTQETTNVITTGCFQIRFQDTNPINLQNAYPIHDEEASNLTPYIFTITNTCDTLVSYQVNLEILNTSTLERLEYINVTLNETKLNLTNDLIVEKTLENAKDSYKLEIGNLKAKESKTFELRVWLDEDTPTINEVMNKQFESKITITVAHQKNIYTEPILNGMDPVLQEELIPVIIESDGVVKKANTETKWYSYEEKNWANAVILKDESVEYQNNEVIPESNIESYFVWIPKYRYQLWDLGNYDGLTTIDTSKVHTIPVIFGDYNTSDEVSGECTTPMESGEPGNCQVGDYMTHPAFLSIPSKGFWVGKFETSKSNTASENSINPEGVQIKPNVESWRNIQVGNAFYTSYEYKRNLDSHMMKNTEWGSVAYLQHSEYGSHTSVRMNNNSNYITGYGSTKEPTCGFTNDNRDCNRYGNSVDITLPYNTETGYLASTTGNITGIYDMSGGSWEYMMGVTLDKSNNFISGRNPLANSGFSGVYAEGGNLTTGYSWPEEKYYDRYQYGTTYKEYTRGILGDATGEMGPFQSIIYGNYEGRQISLWFDDYAGFVYYSGPWFDRGGFHKDGSDTGVFSFGAHTGGMEDSIGFRVVLTP